MLRAGRSIDLRHEVISSNNGIILAPIINIHDLILRSDNKIPEQIKIFLLANKITVNRVKYKGELMVRLMGNFKLSKKIVDDFINQHKALVDAQKVNLQLVSDAKEIGKEISAVINFVTNPNNPKIYGGTVISKQINMHTSNLNNKSAFLAKNTICFNSVNITQQGSFLEAEKIGLFAVSSSVISGKYVGDHKVENALIDSGRTMIFSGKYMQLSLDHDIAWGNNPHCDLLKSGRDKSRVQKARCLRLG